MNEIDEILSNIDKEREQPDEDQRSDSEVMVDPLDAESVQKEPDSAGEKVDLGPEPAPEHPPIQEEEPVEVDIVDFTIKGTKTWNTREPYLIKLEEEMLRNDLINLNHSFYFVEGPSTSEEIKQRIKQEIVKFLRRPNDNITGEYSGFIYRLIMKNVQVIVKDFGISAENEMLFVFHIGPLTMHKIIKEEFIHGTYGFCYKYMPGNKAFRFFPEEFIKEVILKWFEENINTIDLPVDSIQRYEDIKNIAMKKYQNDLKVFNTRLEQVNARVDINKTISKMKLFQMKGVQWFGYHNIEIYRRFIGNSIFL